MIDLGHSTQRGPFVIMQRTDEGYTTMINALKAQ